jgi:hypothetical protein
MPHAILKGPVTAEDIWLSFRPLEFHEGEAHCKATDCLLSADRKTALIRSLVVERSFSRSFLTRVVEKDGTLTLGLDPLGTPERTEGVKRFLGFCAWVILQASPEMELAGGNITDLVRGPGA